MSTYCKKCEKTNCSNNNCPCRRESKLCSNKCGCSNCENRDDVDSSDDESDDEEAYRPKTSKLYGKYPYKKTPVNKTSKVESDEGIVFSDTNQLAGVITGEIRLQVAHKKERVFEFRNNRDLYTNKKKNDVENPQVDHIVEDQIVGHAAANVLFQQSYTPYLKTLKDALNLESLENYNVTLGSINQSKGSLIRTYLRDNINRGLTLRNQIKPETHFGRNMERIFQVMNETHPIVEEFVGQGRRSDGHVTGGPTFGKIADELARIFYEMDLDLETKRTRRKN